MDFLGLRNLDVITDTLEIIQATRGVDLDIDDDRRSTTPTTLELLCRGDSIGVFQLEGGPMRALMRSLAPTQLRGRRRPRGAVPARARWRPTCTTTTPTGRTAGSRSSTSTPTPRSCSADTYGLMIYQESVMRVAQKFAGYSLAEADNLRKAMRQEDPRAHGEGAGEVRRRRARPPATARSSARSCSTSSSSSPTTPSTSRTRSATGSSPTRPPTSRRTTRSSTSPRCSPA